MVTFDDGYRDFYTQAFPVLKQHGFTATMYLPTAFIGRNPLEFKARECLTWDEVRELNQAGMEFGSHTVNHPKLYELGESQIRKELAESKAVIEQELGERIYSFAYPYAFPSADRAFVAMFVRLLQETGYESNVTTRIGRVRADDDAFTLKRLPMNSADDGALFLAKIRGAYDWMNWPQDLCEVHPCRPDALESAPRAWRKFTRNAEPIQNPMTIIVTGAAGFIGSHTVDRLLREGHTVLGLDNLRTGRMENLSGALASPKFRLEKMDITAAGKLEEIVGQIQPQAIIHLAALVSVQESIANPDLNRWLNVEATKLVAAAATAHRVPRVVFASSAAVYGDCPDLPLKESSDKRPLSPYGWAKLESEQLLFNCTQQHKVTAVCLRYFNVYGSRQNAGSPYSGVISIFKKMFSSGQPVTVYGDGEQTRDFIHVGDLARANFLAATRPGLTSQAINICTGRPTPLNQLIEIFRDHQPEAPLARYNAERSGEIRHSLGDPSLAQTALGFSAEILVQEGLKEFAAASEAQLAENNFHRVTNSSPLFP